jgi:hypothetical protein
MIVGRTERRTAWLDIVSPLIILFFDPHGNSFLKKNDNGVWEDVGDRTAAEKTSQGLRERSNAEKRQRSALREALRIRREDLADSPAGESPAKKPKIADPSGMGQLGIVPGYIGVAPQAINYAGTIPLSLSMKEKPKEAKAKKPKAKGDTKEASSSTGDETGESLPPKAKDEDGNILVTDYGTLYISQRLVLPIPIEYNQNHSHELSRLLSLRYSLWARRTDQSPQR